MIVDATILITSRMAHTTMIDIQSLYAFYLNATGKKPSDEHITMSLCINPQCICQKVDDYVILKTVRPLDPEIYCSKGFQALKRIDGLQTLYKYLADTVDFPLVSVGSGNGYVENLCLKNVPNLNMILVEPFFNKFIPVSADLSRKPDYDYVSNLVIDQPTIPNNCSLFINWAYPETLYDVQALFELRPAYVIVCCEMAGTAGSDQFLYWLYKCGIKVDDINPKLLKCSFEALNLLDQYIIVDHISIDGLCTYEKDGRSHYNATRTVLAKLKRMPK